MSPEKKGWAPVYRVVKRVPEGRVATYGQIAALSGMPGAARQVGWALNALNEDHDVPWHRVINAKGEVSRRGESAYEDFQRSLLEAEGIEFGRGGRVNLERFAWKPRGRRPSKSSPRSADTIKAPETKTPRTKPQSKSTPKGKTPGQKKRAGSPSARRKA